MLKAAREGDTRKAALILAAAAAIPLPAVRRAANLRSAKALVSLVWKAGYSMRAGYAMQILLASLPPGAALKAGPGNSFPLSVQEMNWQINFLRGEESCPPRALGEIAAPPLRSWIMFPHHARVAPEA